MIDCIDSLYDNGFVFVVKGVDNLEAMAAVLHLISTEHGTCGVGGNPRLFPVFQWKQ